MMTRILLFWCVLLWAVSASAQDQEFNNLNATKVGIGTTALPSSSSIRIDGLLTSGATDVLLINGSNEVVRRLLGKSDIPSSVAYEDEANTFTSAQSITSTLGITGNVTGNSGTLLLGSPTRISTAQPWLMLRESDQAVSAKNWAWEADGGSLYLRLYDDTPSSSNAAVRLDRSSLVPGDWRWGSLLATVRPENNGSSQLGSLTKQYSTAYIWDLVVGTLTAKEIIATIGGEVIVAPTTSLTRDVGTSDTFIFVKHNQPRQNDTVYLKVNGSSEKMLVTSNYIDCSVSGNCSISGSDFAYSVTRNRQGSGAKSFLAGAAVVNEGNVGDGNIWLYADRSSSVSDGYVGMVVSDGPVAYWRMVATTSTTTADLMGNVGVATETGTQSNGLGVASLSVGTAGVDPAWQNTGGAGSLTVANDSDLQITGDLTVEFIAYWEHTISRGEHILSRVFNGEYYVDVDAAGVLRFCHGNGSTFECEVTTSAVMPVGSWHHYAIVRDSQSSPKRILFYVDGVLVTSATYTQALATSTNTLYIGDTASGTTQFDGYLDEVAIYNYQLTADRILLHANARANDSISKFTIGPTLCGNVRTGTAAFDLAERWCIGNLAGTYGYATSPTTVYGFAAGNASTTWTSIDATNGWRIMSGSTTKVQFDTSGNGFLTGDLTIGSGGSLVGGNFTLNTTGLQVPVTSVDTIDNPFAYKWTGSTRGGEMYLQGFDFGSASRNVYLTNNVTSTNQSVVGLLSRSSGGSHFASLTVVASGTAITNASYIQQSVGSSSITFMHNTAGSIYYIYPTPTTTIDLGLGTNRWRELYFSPTGSVSTAGMQPLMINTSTGQTLRVTNAFSGTCTGTITVSNGMIQSC